MPAFARSLAVAALVALALPAAAQAQTADVVGQVTDTAGDPLPGANVYLSGTTRGTATDADGRFRIPAVELGAYRLVASILGYTAGTEDIRLTEPGEAGPFTFELEESVAELGEVDVTAEGPDPRWLRRYERFKRTLLGESENAALTDIENPYVLDFRERGGTLTATASAPLVIVNRALGYRLTYDLETFEASNTRVRYHGEELFEELTPEDDAEAARWRVARAQAYRGSLRHLLQSLIAGQTEADGFSFVHRALSEDGEQLREYAGRPWQPSDFFVPSEEQAGWYTLRFPGLLGVRYTSEPEVPSYLTSAWFRGARVRPEPFQRSDLRVEDGEATVDPRGTPADPFGVSAMGYIAFERLGDLVPEEYTPPTDGVQTRAATRRPPSRGGRGQ